jgi:hypothetical protein
LTSSGKWQLFFWVQDKLIYFYASAGSTLEHKLNANVFKKSSVPIHMALILGIQFDDVGQ